ncbi:MAG: class I SAM-dependent methyltransferase [Verrucomicrobiales bacterium]|nr:class I SAM-dependent methyltransferase [Verrucomicrobiales bacterium]
MPTLRQRWPKIDKIVGVPSGFYHDLGPVMLPRLSHQDTYYRNNEAYAEFLAQWDSGFYAKYTDALRPARAGGRVLDVGCGVGQVVGKLSADGIEAHGVEISEPNVARALKVCPRVQWYDGRRLPFPDAHFDAVGTLNVLEHVDEPEAYLEELVRVTAVGGRVVVSSPNFLRVIGPGYHPRMQGLGQRWRNFKALMARRRRLREAPDQVRFERMTPIVRQPFQPDDDATVATNSLEMAFFLERLGCQVERVDCTDRVVPALAEWMLNATPLKWAMFNAFVVARRVATPAKASSK